MEKSTENGTDISPNLLKYFNPYELLKPQSSNGPQVIKLIDIDEPTLKIHESASLLDQKTDYDLIDLYQNMYVTPHQVKARKSTETNDDDVGCKNIDYKDFFDKLESGERLDWTKSIVEKQCPNNEDVNLIDKSAVRPSKLADEGVSDPEDLIDEVIAKKNLERIFANKQDKIDNTTNMISDPDNIYIDVNEFTKMKVLDAPSNIQIKYSTNTDINRKPSEPNITRTKNARHDCDLIAEFPGLKEKVCHVNDLNNDTHVPQAFNKKIEGQILNVSDFQVIAMNKDEKVYKKHRIVKPECQKGNYSRGADYFEKIVVLPQIVANIKSRQRYLEERRNKRNRLVLDSGAKVSDCNSSSLEANPANIKKENIKCFNCSCKESGKTNAYMSNFGEISPDILMADCNKERLKSLYQRQMFKNFIEK